MNGAGLPRLWRGERRWLLVGLGLAGLCQAGAATASALLTPRLLTVADRQDQLVLAGMLVLTASVLGLMRVAERVLGERLGQSYVHQIRMHLVRAALVGRGPSVGVTVARTTNDLTSVRNWVVLGIVPLLVGIPMLVGSLFALGLLSPLLAAAVAVPVAVLAVVLVQLAAPMRERAARLRKRRGRMAGAITDAVQASDSIVVDGGLDRELRRLSQDSREVGARAVDRAVLSGWARGAAASLATTAMVVVGAVGALAGIDAATIAAAFIIVGMVAQPVTDLGRVSEYRQSFRVAERILGPEVERSREHRRRERALARGRRQHAASGSLQGVVHLADLWLQGRPVPELVASPGEVIVPRSENPAQVAELIHLLAHPSAQPSAWLQVSGLNLGRLPAQERRALVGHAGGAVTVERGTIARAVRYRCPESEAEVMTALRRVGLDQDVLALEQRERTQLRRGGEPLDAQQRRRLHLARAWYDDPALVVLDRVDSGLDAEGRRLLARGIARTPGVTILVSQAADELAPHHRIWQLDGNPAIPALPRLEHLPAPPKEGDTHAHVPLG